jgi:hypothetical protein
LQIRLHNLQDELLRLQDSVQGASSRPSPPPATVTLATQVGIGVTLISTGGRLTLTSIKPDGAAAASGNVKVGDVLVAVNDVTVTSEVHAKQLILGPCGTSLKAKLLRGGQSVTVTLWRGITNEVEKALLRCKDESVVPLQPVEEPKSLHQNVDEKNWRTAGTLIFHACNQARQFVNDSFCALHKSILKHIDATFGSATASGERQFCLAEFLPDFEGYQNCIRQKYALHVIDCHASFAQQNLNRVRHMNDQVSYQEFLDPSRRIRIAWRNSDTNFWFDSMLGPFEMAKLFCKSFGSLSPPTGFGDLEPGSLFRMLRRCTFFTVPWMNTGQLLRPRTLTGCLWSYKRWKAAYSSCALDSDDLSRIRLLLSNFIQEISVAKSDLANLASIEEYFDFALDSFAGTSIVTLSIDTSRHGGSNYDGVSLAGSNSDRQESSLNDFDFDEVYSSIMAHARDSLDFVHRKLEVQSDTQSNTLQLSIQEFVKLNLIEAYLLVQVSHIHRILHISANLFSTAFFVHSRCCCSGGIEWQRQD